MAIVKSRLLQKIYKKYPNFYKKDLEKFFNIILEEIKYSLKKGERVELRGFGTWSTHIQKARISRNPKTGDEIQIAAANVPAFVAGKALKDSVK